MIYTGKATQSTILNNWEVTPGNYIEYVYYTGVVNPGNPSGSTTNIQYMNYYDTHDVLKHQIEIHYDIGDKVIKTIGNIV